MIKHAAVSAGQPLAAVPDDFDARMTEIGLRE
jgi:hypothetical protein